MEGYKILQTFLTYELAEIAAEGLRREGIEAKTNPNHKVSTHGYAFPTTGVPVYVLEAQFAEASRVMNVKFENLNAPDIDSEDVTE
ncbi:MAG: hypothetical protein HRT45_11535 [Bdellovibrionales bacterium]|nr:hypothetical protein [Bdellovibrionales bacterium]